MRGEKLNYSTLYNEIVKILNKNDKGLTFCVNQSMSESINLWDEMYKNQAKWIDNKKVFGANLPAAISSEFAKLTTIEMEAKIEGSPLASFLDGVFQKELLPKLRKYVEYGFAKGSLIIKPIPTDDGLRVQFNQAGAFFPISFDGAGKIVKCVFAEQQRRGKNVYTLLEIHTLQNGRLTIENRAFRSANDVTIGLEIPLSEVDEWATLGASATFEGLDSLPFGLFCCPMANQVDTNSPLGVSVYSRAWEQIREADKRYSSICWEYEATQAAVHIAESLLKLNKETGKFEVPDGRERLYRAVPYATGATETPLLDVYSPEIRSSPLFDGWNNQLRMIEFNCSLAYGTLSDPNNVDKTAEEIRTSKQRSYTFVKDSQEALETALNDWMKAAAFWAQVYGFAPAGNCKLTAEWGDSILSDPDAERNNDRQDLANGTLRPEEYRAKWRDETIEEALANLPQTAEVLE